MSPLFTRRRDASVSPEDLARRASSLAGALEAGGAQVDPLTADHAQAVVEKVEDRTGLGAHHTVVALAGATGSGKSTLFNAVVGEDVATVGARRPTTAAPTAAVWGEDRAGRLLDWLGVGERHLVTGGSAGPEDPLDGLVLLDLPDFDSRVTSHRDEVERILHLVDVFVWVTDPQKYADARLHDDYVARLHRYDAVTLVVLNQSDRLTADALDSCSADLRRLLERDGLGTVRLVTTSGADGTGLAELRERLAEALSGAHAVRDRLDADVRTLAEQVRAGVGDTEPDRSALASDELVEALARAGGLATVVDAVERDYRREAWAHTGWPFTRWVRALRPSPLRRLRLEDRDAVVTASDVRQVLGRSSLPAPSPAARAGVELATRRLGQRAASGLPRPWAEAVREAATPPGDDLADALDQAVVSTPLRARAPLWWPVFGGLQVLLAAAAVLGALWLGVDAAFAWLQLPDLPRVELGPVTLPFVLLVGGVGLGLLLAALARALARAGARRRGALIRGRLHRAVAETAEERVVEPILAVLGRHRRTREELDAALT